LLDGERAHSFAIKEVEKAAGMAKTLRFGSGAIAISFNRLFGNTIIVTIGKSALISRPGSG